MMKKKMPSEGLRLGRDSGSILCDTLKKWRFRTGWGGGTEIITVSHNIDSPEWEHKKYGLTIEDFVWLPTNVLILPSCRKIGYGAVVGSGSVVVKDVEPMSVVSGNPAKEFKKRKCVHSSLVVESLLGGDYMVYKQTWKNRNIEKMKK